METINHEYYVSLEVAKLLKEAGFDWEGHYPRNFCYVNDSPKLFDKSVLKHYTEKDDVIYLAPTLDVAQRWLREVKNMSVGIFFEKPGKWSCSIILDTNKGVSFENFWREEFDYDTYEEALEAGIKEALELILEKGK